MTMVKTSDLSRVTTYKSYKDMFKQVASNLARLHKYTTSKVKTSAIKRGT